MNRKTENLLMTSLLVAAAFCLHGIAKAAPAQPKSFPACTPDSDLTHLAILPFREVKRPSGQVVYDYAGVLTLDLSPTLTRLNARLEAKRVENTLTDLGDILRDKTVAERQAKRVVGTTRFGATALGFNSKTRAICVKSSAIAQVWKSDGSVQITPKTVQFTYNVANAVRAAGYDKTLIPAIEKQIKDQEYQLGVEAEKWFGLDLPLSLKQTW